MTIPQPSAPLRALPPRIVGERQILGQDEVDAFRSVARASTGLPARDGSVPSPVHPFVLAFPSFRGALAPVLDAAGLADHEAATIHVSEMIDLHRPLRCGQPFTVATEVVATRAEPAGTRVCMHSTVESATRERLATLRTGAVVLGVSLPTSGVFPRHPSAPRSGAADTVPLPIPEDLPTRYAAVSGDTNPIHVDEVAARRAGFPSVIAHGMSVLALACEAVVDRCAAGDMTSVRSVGARFSTPVVPGSVLELQLRPDPSTGTVWFQCRASEGVAVKNGWVSVEGSLTGLGEVRR